MDKEDYDRAAKLLSEYCENPQQRAFREEAICVFIEFFKGKPGFDTISFREACRSSDRDWT